MSAVLYEKASDGYAVFTSNRPEVLNAMNTELREQFSASLDGAAAVSFGSSILSSDRSSCKGWHQR